MKRKSVPGIMSVTKEALGNTVTSNFLITHRLYMTHSIISDQEHYCVHLISSVSDAKYLHLIFCVVEMPMLSHHLNVHRPAPLSNKYLPLD